LELLQAGTGRPLLFLHAGDGLDWQSPMIADLSARFQLVAPSHPGFGNSELPRHFSTVSDLAYFYLDLLDQLDLRDVVVVGCSFGGWIALEMATKSCERISRLVLADTVGVKFAGREVREIADLFSLTPHELADAVFCDSGPLAPDYSKMTPEELAVAARNRESFTLFGWSPTLHNPKLKHRLHRVKAPTLVLWGAEDRVVSPDYGRSLVAALPEAGFEMIADAGHYPHVEKPAEFASRVAAFASSRRSSRG
jgi:pimeloyl-ACP methyl ester carboxylesterase